MKWTVVCLGVAMGIASTSASAEIQMVYVNTATVFKTSTAQASSLSASQKCAVKVGAAYETNTPTIESGHLKVTLKKTLPGCAFGTGYFYEPHVAKSNTAITVYANTVFKKSTADSSSLPASSKCDMPIGVYRLSGTVSDVGSHYSINLAAFLPNCGFSQGYVYEEHAVPGVQAVSLVDSAYLKVSTADSSTLAASQKCLVAAGNYVLAAPPDAEGTHYQLNFARALSGCAFRSGFMFHANTMLADPATASSAGYTFPLTGGVLGSGWCVCRSVGTSPHIGQDTYTLSGTMRAVAIADGVIDDKFFDASCGHFLILKDNGGALWRYVHLNSPSVAIGTRVTRGQQLATISAYPTSSCGTGPHLHWERRSAGAFADSATGKDCGQGFRSCNYDPVKPFRSSKQADIANTVPLMEGVEPTSNVDNVVRPVLACRADAARYPEAKVLGEGALEVDSAFAVALQSSAHEGQSVLTASAAVVGNEGNLCLAEQGLNCITSWSVLAERSDGSWVRVFHDPAVRNSALKRVAEEAFCVPETSTGRYRMLLKDLNGRAHRQDFELN